MAMSLRVEAGNTADRQTRYIFGNVYKEGHVKARNDEFAMMIQAAEIGPEAEGFHPVQLTTRRGTIHCRYYPVADAAVGAIWVGGVGGGWDTPAQGLYPQLCQELQSQAIASLRVCYRYPTEIQEAVFDVLAGLAFLEDQGISSVALIGHSFGGAVVIQAAAQAEAVQTVVTLATQSFGTDLVLELATRCSLLLIHGTADPVLPPACSEYVYQTALEPKRLMLYPDATHGLDEVATEVHEVVRDWLVEHLGADAY